jgi:hypothetical protein
MTPDEEKIAAILRRLSGRPREGADRFNCPDDESLAVFLSGDFSGDRGKIIEAHLAECSFCLDEIVAASKADGAEIVPQYLIHKAQALVESREPLFELVARLFHKSIELIETSGRIVSMPLPVVRGAAKAGFPNALQVEQKVGRFRIAVEIEVSEPETCQIVANVTEDTGLPAEGVRLSLNSDEREHASFLTRGGIVVFDRIAPGEYSIAVSESGTSIGRIKLSLMLER